MLFRSLCFEYGFITLPGQIPVIPSVIAHRGDSANAPDNSHMAFCLAIRSGADCLEADIQNTADGIPVAAHDNRLRQPVLSKDGIAHNYISEVSSRQLPSLCSLEQLLILNQNSIDLNLDLKAADAVEETIRLLQKYGACKHSMITSASPNTLQQIKLTEPRIATVLLLSSFSDFEKYAKYQNKSYVDGFSVKSCHITASLVSAIHRRGKFILAWTVNSEAELCRMQQLSVDGIITDDPSRALSVLTRHSKTSS